MEHNYYVYIVTNKSRTTLYVGVTNNLLKRLYEHFQNQGNSATFAGRYHCYNLIYWERFQYVKQAIEREKEIKGWTRMKKVALIESFNKEWRFLNDEIW